MYCLGLYGSPALSHEEPATQGWPFDWFHDASAVLLKDGKVVAGVAQERLDRVKHSNAFPVEAIRLCLDQAGICLSDISRFAYPCDEGVMNGVMQDNARQVIRGTALPISVSGTSARDILRNLLCAAFGVDLPAERIVFIRHHLAHAMSAYAHSGFDDALLYVRDGWGDGLSGIVALGSSGSLEQIASSPASHSLGSFYLTGTRMLGYLLGDEYKVMGLAPYGDPTVYRPLLDTFVTGTEMSAVFDLQSLWRRLAHELGGIRERNSLITQKHKDLAAAFQHKLEQLALDEISHWKERTGQLNLCCAGGVAQNCSLTGKIRASGIFEKVFVPAAPDDGGLALGAALVASLEQSGGNSGRQDRLKTVFWGSAIDRADEVEVQLRRWNEVLTYTKVANGPLKAAQALAEGKVIGWARGRSEFGPRALGNRSILADPRPRENRSRINRIVKKRESFRPFAPSVIEEELTTFFEIRSHEGEFSFMTFVTMVREQYRGLLGAVTHVDGSARVQSVSRDSNPDYWKLISDFGSLTGIPIVLNTSFNNNAEPIVETAADVIACYLTTDLDALMLGDFWVEKLMSGPAICSHLSPSLPKYSILERAQLKEDRKQFTIRSKRRPGHIFEIPESVFDALHKSQISETLDANSLGIFYDLWCARMIQMAPTNTRTADNE